jgi:uncharacterized membrane protein YgaE (UPF0421/DUF939 family)
MLDRLQALRWHPRTAMAVKAATASVIAWLLVQPLGGVADRLPYYAPLGAVIAVGTTFVGSARDALRGLLGILLGAGLALGVMELGLPEVLALGAVVAAGTLLAGWWRVRPQADWVPLTALFVLIIGRADPLDFAVGYLGLTSLGALVGLGVNLVFPPLPLSPARTSVSRLRDLLADQLDDLADGLFQVQVPCGEEWGARKRAIEPMTRQMRETVDRATEARRGNWRVERWRQDADRQYHQARALEQLALLVQEVAELVTHHAYPGDDAPLGPSVRPAAADALRATAATLRSVDGPTADPACLVRADAACRRLREQVRRSREEYDDDMLVAGTVVLTLTRALHSLAPGDLALENRVA